MSCGTGAVPFHIISRTIKDKGALSRQMLLYRDFIKAVFLGVPAT